MSALPIDSSNPAMTALLAKSGEIAVLPHVVYRILEMTDSTDAAASQVEAAITIDPGFSARLLTQANSAYYGLPRKVTSIREAVTYLGFRAVRQLAMTVGVFDLFVGKNDEESLRRRSWWRHSVDTAVIARYLAQKLKLGRPDESYTSGLLHYIGKTVLDRYNPDAYASVFVAQRQCGDDRLAEMRVYGCDHVEVAMAVATKWGFPESLIMGMNYLDPPEPEDPYTPLRTSVFLADRIAIAVRSGSQDFDLAPIGGWAASSLNLADETLLELIQESTRLVAEAAKS